MGYPVLTAGLVMAPRGMGTMLSMFFVGRLIGRIDGRLMTVDEKLDRIDGRLEHFEQHEMRFETEVELVFLARMVVNCLRRPKQLDGCRCGRTSDRGRATGAVVSPRGPRPRPTRPRTARLDPI